MADFVVVKDSPQQVAGIYNIFGLKVICSIVFVLSSMSLFCGCASDSHPFTKDWPPRQGSYENILDKQRRGLAMEEVPEEEPDMTAEEHERLGDQYLQQGNMDESFVQYYKALNLNPAETGVRYKMGLLFLRKGLPDGALKEFQEVLKEDDSYALAYEGAGQAFMQMGEYDEAEKRFQKALQLDPDLWLSHNNLGMIYDRKFRFDDAIAHYETAITIKPNQDILLNNLGLSYYLNGEYLKSVDTLLKAAQAGSNPKNAKVYNNLGLALGKLQRYDEALEAFKKAGDRAAAYNNLGYVYFLQKEYDKAIVSFEKAIEIKPSFYQSANENLKMSRKALADVVE